MKSGAFWLFRNPNYTEICTHLQNLAENVQYYDNNDNGRNMIFQQHYSGNIENGLERIELWPAMGRLLTHSLITAPNELARFAIEKLGY